jgi:peptide/nickel transport system substrate-binding protein
MIRKNCLSFTFILLLLSAFMIFSFSCAKKDASDNDGIMKMNVPLRLEIKGLDPAQANDLYTHTVISQVYESLFQYSYLERPFKVEPLLAESMPEFSDDKLTCTIKIKKGVLFQDDPCFKESGGKGRELTAKDFIFSFKRIADKRVNSNGWWIFKNHIKGLDEFREKSPDSKGMDIYDEEVEGLSAPDDHTLVIQLKDKYPQLKFVLTMSYSCVVPREAVEMYGEEFINHAVGTGPFKLDKWVRKSKIVFIRNPAFRGEAFPSEGTAEDMKAGFLTDAGKNIPFLDKITFRIMKESSVMWLEFMAGNFDKSGIPKDNYSGAITDSKDLKNELKEKGITLWKTPRLDLTYVAFNMVDPLLGKSLALRQALSLSLDVEQIIPNLYNNRAIRAMGPVPPGLAGYDPDFMNPLSEFNMDEAKEKLKEAKKELGLSPDDEITLTYDSQSNDTTSRQMDEFMVESFKELGINMKYNVNTWPQFLDRIKNRKGQVWGSAWGADYPDAENFLQLLYGPHSSPGDNSANYSNPEFDKLYKQASNMEDCTERTEILKKMVKIVTEDCPWIFCTHRIGFALNHAWLKNYKPHDLAVNTFKYYRIDDKVKKELKPKL